MSFLLAGALLTGSVALISGSIGTIIGEEISEADSKREINHLKSELDYHETTLQMAGLTKESLRFQVGVLRPYLTAVLGQIILTNEIDSKYDQIWVNTINGATNDNSISNGRQLREHARNYFNGNSIKNPRRSLFNTKEKINLLGLCVSTLYTSIAFELNKLSKKVTSKNEVLLIQQMHLDIMEGFQEVVELYSEENLNKPIKYERATNYGDNIKANNYSNDSIDQFIQNVRPHIVSIVADIFTEKGLSTQYCHVWTNVINEATRRKSTDPIISGLTALRVSAGYFNLPSVRLYVDGDKRKKEALLAILRDLVLECDKQCKKYIENAKLAKIYVDKAKLYKDCNTMIYEISQITALVKNNIKVRY